MDAPLEAMAAVVAAAAATAHFKAFYIQVGDAVSASGAVVDKVTDTGAVPTSSCNSILMHARAHSCVNKEWQHLEMISLQSCSSNSQLQLLLSTGSVRTRTS